MGTLIATAAATVDYAAAIVARYIETWIESACCNVIFRFDSDLATRNESGKANSLVRSLNYTAERLQRTTIMNFVWLATYTRGQ